MPKLDIIVVNWNSGKQLENCLISIAKTSKKNFFLEKIVVVDNGSSDGSEIISPKIDLPLVLIKNYSNRGFAYACNQGAENCKSDYLLFLNPDTVLFEKSLLVPVEFMEKKENEKIGICGIQLVDENNNIHRHSSYFPSIKSFWAKKLALSHIFPKIFKPSMMIDWDHRESREVDQVIGAFFLVRRDLFEKLNKFDERFFVYYEETDFTVRAYQAGWKSFYLANVQAFHKGNGCSDQVKAKRLFYNWRSQIVYFYKHFDRLNASLLLLGTLILEPFIRSIYNLLKLSISGIIEIFIAYFYLMRDIPCWSKMIFYSDRVDV